MSLKKNYIKPVQHFIEYQLVRLIFFAFNFLSFKALGRLGDFLGSFTFRFVRIRRAVTLDNLTHAFPEKSDREILNIAHRTYRNFGRTFFQFLGMAGLSKAEIRRIIDFGDGLRLLQDVLKEGKGGIVNAAHFGNWELLSIAFGAYDLPGCALVLTQKNRQVDDLINSIRSCSGVVCVPLGISVREIIRALRRNGFVGIVGDQSFRTMNSVWVQFFGRPVLTAQGTAAFVLKTGAPLICGLAYHQPDGRLVAKFERLEYGPLSGDPKKDIQQITQAFTTRLEHEIRRHPDQWFWMHRRWKHSHQYVPDSEPEVSD